MSDPFTLEGALEIIKPHNDRILAEARLAAAEDRLKAANKIIAEQNEALAQAHSALKGLLRIVEAVRFTTGLGANQLARCDAARAVIAKIEGRS